MRRQVLLVILGLLAFVCTAVQPELGAAASKHPFLGAITGENIRKTEQLKGACGVAVDSVGDIYVADYYQNRVVVFDPNHVFLTELTGIHPLDSQGVGPLDGPCDLAVDSAGNLYVNNYHRDVVKITPAEYPPHQGTLYGPAIPIDTAHPTGVAVNPSNGEVYVNDRTSIAVYEAPVGSGDEPALRLGVGSLEDGYGVALSGFPGSVGHPSTAGHVYVADAANEAVKVYDPLGDPAHPIELIDGEATPRGAFQSLVDSDLAIDPGDGHLYVADNLQPGFEDPEAIAYEFSELGHYRGQLPSPKAEGESSFLRHGGPSAITLGPDQKVYVTSGNYEDAVVFIFGPAPAVSTHLLAVAKTGGGTGTVASSPPGLRCGGACEGEFENTSRVTLFAISARGSRLAGWGGCDEQLTATSCTVAMTTDRAVTAEFSPAPQKSLIVARTGAGSGTVVSSPFGVECGSTCEDEFDEGSSVVLTAAPAAGSRLVDWSGCDSQPTSSSCQVTMAAARSVTVQFETLPSGVEGVREPGQGRASVPTVALPAHGGLPPLRIRKATVKGRTATLRVEVPQPGELSVSGRALRSSRVICFHAGETTVQLALSPAGKAAFIKAKRGKLAVKAIAGFAPFDEGPALRATAKLTFRTDGRGR
jgi:DNA-binding beta-propeller fold protein YncE